MYSDIDNWLNSNIVKSLLYKMKKRWNLSYDETVRAYFMEDLGESYKIIKLDICSNDYTKDQLEEIKKSYDDGVQYAISKNWIVKKNCTAYDDILYFR